MARTETRHPQQRTSRSTLALIFVGGFIVLATACAGLTFGLLKPALASAREATVKARSAASLGTIAKALLAYAAENGGEMPEHASEVADRLVPRYLATVPEVGPTTSKPSPAWHYVPLGNISGKSDSGRVILVFEAPGMWARAGGNLAYADGRVIWIDGLQYDDLVKNFIPASR
jgi:hypothetical protein